MYLVPPGRGGGRKGPGCSGRLAPGPLPAPRRAEESGPQFPQFLYLGAATHSRSASRPASPAFSVRELRASCRLTQLRCWVAPSPEVSSPASGPAHFLRSRSSVRLRRGHTRPLFLHTSAGVNPARSVPGSKDTAVPAVGADSVSLFCIRDAAQTATDCAVPPASAVLPLCFYSKDSASSRRPLYPASTSVPRSHGEPFRLRPRRPSVHPSRRSLPLLQGA